MKKKAVFVVFVLAFLWLAPQAEAQHNHRRQRGTDYILAANDWVDGQVALECSQPNPPGYCGGRHVSTAHHRRDDREEHGEAWDDRMPYSARSSRSRMEFSLVNKTPFILEVFDGERFLWRLGPREARKVPPPREAYGAKALVPSIRGTIQIVDVPATPETKGGFDTSWVFSGVAAYNNTGCQVKIINKRTRTEQTVAPGGATVLFGDIGEFEAWGRFGGRFRQAVLSQVDSGMAITSP